MPVRVLVLALLLAGCTKIEADVNTTVIPGNSNGDVYFHCSGFVTSTVLWISSDPTGERHDSDYVANASRSEALARVVGDTLEVFSVYRFEAAAEPALPYVLSQREIEGREWRMLQERKGEEGLTEVQC